MTINASDLFKVKKILWSDYKDEIESSNQETVYERYLFWPFKTCGGTLNSGVAVFFGFFTQNQVPLIIKGMDRVIYNTEALSVMIQRQ